MEENKKPVISQEERAKLISSLNKHKVCDSEREQLESQVLTNLGESSLRESTPLVDPKKVDSIVEGISKSSLSNIQTQEDGQQVDTIVPSRLNGDLPILGLDGKPIPNHERVVFGIGIGKDCFYKTPAQAFVERLRGFEVEMALAKTGVQDKQKIIEEHQAFLAGGYKAELREDESAEEMLAEALKYSQIQQESYIAKAQKMEEGINKDEGFVSIIGKPYSDSVSRDIAASYEKVSGQVTELMNPAETQGQTE